eukprot:35388-Pleurochrysis_carterae.AAC.1
MSDILATHNASAALKTAGQVKSGLMLHPSDKYIIYSLGSTVVIRNVEDQTDQTFLQGERGNQTRLCVSHSLLCLAVAQWLLAFCTSSLARQNYERSSIACCLRSTYATRDLHGHQQRRQSSCDGSDPTHGLFGRCHHLGRLGTPCHASIEASRG